MSWILMQAATALQIRNQSGTITTLTLPTDVTIDSSKKPRFAFFGKYTVVVNSTSRPITVDPTGIVRVLTPKAPEHVIVIDDDGGAGGLTGNYKALQTFLILDEYGNVIAESDYSPAMETAFAAAADTLNVESLNLSLDAVSASRIYRTATDGSVYFQWIDVDGNTLTQSVSDDTADLAIGLIAAPTLGSPPALTLIANWGGRLWGVDRVDIDHARYTEAGSMYAWPQDNDILIGREGSDIRGVTAIMPRRDALGFGRRDGIFQVTGTSADNLRCVTLTENCGVESQESVVIYRDTAYWLWKDGVYQWDSEGIKCISDGKVRTWFTSDTYFNRARFPYAFAVMDPIRNKYKLFLAAAGSSSEDRWIEYDLQDKTWWGPHKTGAFTPTCAFVVPDANDTLSASIGSAAGFISQDSTTVAVDWASTGIDVNWDTKFHDGNTPGITKAWLDLTLIGKAQTTTGGTLTITPKVGYYNAAAGAAISASMAFGRQTLRRLGVGEMVQLNFSHTTASEPVEIYGYEIPFYEIGRRS